MALLRITCPECGAGLKSSSGFTAGKTITCPKCESDFVVEDPDEEPAPKAKAKPPTKKLKAVTAAVADDEDEEEDRPKKKKKKKKRGGDEDEEEWSYKNSWIRFAVLGVLLVVLVVLGLMLREKWKKEKEGAEAPAAPSRDSSEEGRAVEPRIVGGRPGGQPLPRMIPGTGVVPKNPPAGNPAARPGPQQGAQPGLAVPGIPLLGGPADPAEAQKRTEELKRQLAGAWRADLGNGVTQRIEYRSDGTYTDTVAGGDKARTLSGTWKVAGLLGSKSLKLDRTGGGPAQVRVVFEGDEIVHDTGDPGVTAVFRKA